MIFSNFNKKEICLLVTGTIGFVLVIVSVVLATVVIPDIVEKTLRDNVVIENGTEPWDRFVELPFPIDFSATLFELTNPDDVRQGKKPIVEEVGPFVYEQRRKKEILEVDGEHVTYKQKQTYDFSREKTPSHLNPKQKVKMLNALLLGMYQIMEDSDVKLFDLDEILPEIFDEYDLATEVTVQELLFDGINFCNPAKTKKFQSKIVCLLVMLLNLKMVNYEQDRSMSYSFLGFKNNKDDGIYKINTGINDIQKVGSIVSWNNLKYMDYWKEENSSCNEVRGLDSTIYPPHVEEGTTFDIFTTDLCSVAPLVYDKPSTYRNVDTFKFKMDENMFWAKNRDKPEEDCYCLKKTRGLNGKPSCFLDGLLDLRSCLGIPGLMSLPHLLNANPVYNATVENMNPDINNHSTDMDLQPFTGIPTRGAKRVQINLILRPMEVTGMGIIEPKMTRSVLPILWIEEKVELNDEYYDILTSSLQLINGVNIGKWVFVGVSAAIFLIPNSLFFYLRMRK